MVNRKYEYSKIIFMGDKCQLPPVNEKLSMIYDFDYDQHIQNVLTNIRNHN